MIIPDGETRGIYIYAPINNLNAVAYTAPGFGCTPSFGDGNLFIDANNLTGVNNTFAPAFNPRTF